MTFDNGGGRATRRPSCRHSSWPDAEGAKPFLPLTGPEPDHEVEAFVTATADDSPSALGAGPMITYFGVPMGIPHTRPLGVITHASRPGLVPSKVALPAQLQVPASAASLMEYRFYQDGRDATRPGRPGAALPGPGRLPVCGPYLDRGRSPR